MNRKEVLLLSIGVFLTIIAWMIADLAIVINNDQLGQMPAVQTIRPVRFDMGVLEQLRTQN